MAAKRPPLTKHSIGVAVRRTGLKPDVIRAWEKRYGAIEPGRTPTNRRFYTDEELDRLILLRQATLGGRQIGQIAGLSTEELRQLVDEDRAAISSAPRRPQPEARVPSGSHFSACLAAIEDLDPYQLRFTLERAATDLTQPKLLEDLLIPLLEKMGESWERGDMRVVHEHVASSVIRTFLANLQDGFVVVDNAPSIVVGTPMRQGHELGALIASATAASEGWKVTYLGSGLPAEEIASAAHLKGAEVVALSLVYPTGDPYLASELKKLRRLLGDERSLIVGGSAATGYSKTLDSISAILVEDLSQLREALRRSSS